MTGGLLSTVGTTLSVLSTLLGVLIFVLAVAGYRRNRSRSMLVLGTGIVTLTLVNTVSTTLAASAYGISGASFTNGLTKALGMLLILVAILLARRE